jgi:hypothetical protein
VLLKLLCDAVYEDGELAEVVEETENYDRYRVRSSPLTTALPVLPSSFILEPTGVV